MFKPQFKSWAFVMAIFVVYGILFKSVSMIMIMISVLGLISCFNSFSYDKQYRCDEYLAAMPVSRKTIVLSKYSFIFCLDAILTVTAMVFTTGYALFSGESIPELLSEVGAILMVTVFMQSILMPMIYILGIDKARYLNTAIWLLPWVLIMLFRDRLPKIGKEQVLMILKITPVITAVLMVISIGVSVAVYRRKDL